MGGRMSGQSGDHPDRDRDGDAEVHPRITPDRPPVHPPQPSRAPVSTTALGAELAAIDTRSQTRVLAPTIVTAFLAFAALVALCLGPLAGSIGAISAIWILGAGGWVVFVLVAVVLALLPPLLAGERDRAVSAAHAWVGARQARRLLGRAERAIDLPTDATKAAAWLRRTPLADQPRILRVEALIVVERYDEARDEASHLPDAEPLDSYSRAEAFARIAYQAGEPVDETPLAAAAERIPPGLDRLEARVRLAAFEARRALPDGDWRAPLLAVRPEIPGSDRRILVTDLGLPGLLILARRVVAPLTILFALLLVTGTGVIWLVSR